MTTVEKLKRDIETLKESIKIDGIELAIRSLTPVERQGILNHMAWCATELQQLIERLNVEEK